MARILATIAILTFVRVQDFDYELPEELIAQQPLVDRSASRMLVINRAEGRWADKSFRDLPSYLRAGDCLILNDSRVFASRLFATRPAGPARIEVFLIKRVSSETNDWQALVRPGRKVGIGERLTFDGGMNGEVIDRGDYGERTIRFPIEVDVMAEADRTGHVPLPPYIHRDDHAEDRERYQTVYARQAGSVAAPTAGLHFTAEALDQCRHAGADFARVTLHVGLGTFAPLHAEELADVRLHYEHYRISESDLDRIRSATRRVAVGTTSVRTIETVYATGETSGETNLFISPGYQFRAVNALLTNFHLPQSSLLMLVSAFAGLDLTLEAYRHAVRERYRFFSYGDCMLVV